MLFWRCSTRLSRASLRRLEMSSLLCAAAYVGTNDKDPSVLMLGWFGHRFLLYHMRQIVETLKLTGCFRFIWFLCCVSSWMLSIKTRFLEVSCCHIFTCSWLSTLSPKLFFQTIRRICSTWRKQEMGYKFGKRIRLVAIIMFSEFSRNKSKYIEGGQHLTGRRRKVALFYKPRKQNHQQFAPISSLSSSISYLQISNFLFQTAQAFFQVSQRKEANAFSYSYSAGEKNFSWKVIRS